MRLSYPSFTALIPENQKLFGDQGLTVLQTPEQGLLQGSATNRHQRCKFMDPIVIVPIWQNEDLFKKNRTSHLIKASSWVSEALPLPFPQASKLHLRKVVHTEFTLSLKVRQDCPLSFFCLLPLSLSQPFCLCQVPCSHLSIFPYFLAL